MRILSRSRRKLHNEGVRLTRGGFVFLAGLALIGLTSVDADINLLLLMFGFCAGAYVVNAVHGWRALRRLSVRRIVPESVVAGQPFQLRYVVMNRHSWAIARSVILEDVMPAPLRDRSPRAFIRSLRPGESVTLNVPYVCHQRGRVALRAVRLLSRFPFNLVSKSVRIRSEQDLIVCPALGRMLTDAGSAAHSSDASTTGSAAGRSRGDEEYFGVREYRHGDNPRKIHWRRSARTGQLVIRETAQTVNRQYWCAVDTRCRRGEADALESAISAAATFVCSALEQGASVGLICNGEPLVMLPPGTGRAHRPRLMRELALRAGNHNDSLAEHVRRHPWPARWHAPCVFFTARDDDESREATSCLNRALGPTRRLLAHSPGLAALIVLPKAGGDAGTPPGTPRKEKTAA